MCEGPEDPRLALGRGQLEHRIGLLIGDERHQRAAVVAVVGAIILTILFAMIPHIEIPWYFSLPVALGLLLIPAYYHLKRNMIRYTVTDSKIEIDYGLIARTTRNIPLSKIQDVTVSASIFQRILGFGDVVIDNASEVGGTTILHNINNPRQHADLLLRELRRWQ